MEQNDYTNFKKKLLNKEVSRLNAVGAVSKNLKERIRFTGEFWVLFKTLLIQHTCVYSAL